MGREFVNLRADRPVMERVRKYAATDPDVLDISKVLRKALRIGMDQLEGIGRAVRETGVETEE